ncbi:MAG TPA: YbaB/EbfC family nucleoid-associated protein [Planctomycetota bacterium]|nr:YbaB/EbfC family nucleoid-associated protein [Planctomycetota bacterium]
MTQDPGLAGLGDILKQAREMSRHVAETREKLRHETYTASVGGDLVTAVVNGAGEVVKVEIAPSALDGDDREMLEDLVTAAVNEALRKAREASRQALSRLTGGIDVAGMLGLS